MLCKYLKSFFFCSAKDYSTKLIHSKPCPPLHDVLDHLEMPAAQFCTTFGPPESWIKKPQYSVPHTDWTVNNKEKIIWTGNILQSHTLHNTIILSFDFCRFCLVTRFFIRATMVNDLWIRRIFYPRFYPLHLFPYLNSWERASISFSMFSAWQGHY